MTCRILLRSMGSRQEANTYGYCALVWLTVVSEIQSVLIPAQLAFTVSGIYMVNYESDLHELANLYLMYQVVLRNPNQTPHARCAHTFRPAQLVMSFASFRGVAHY